MKAHIVRSVAAGSIALAAMLLLPLDAGAQVPNMVSVQAVLRNAAGEVVSGTYNVTFTVYDAQTGGNAKYTQTETLNVVGGFVNVYLGPLPDKLFANNANLYIGIKAGSEPELPRRPFATTGYAFYAERAKWADNAMGPPSDLVCVGCVGTTDLENPLNLAGDLNVQGNVNSCLANATGCGMKVSTESGIFDRNDGFMNLQASAGVRVRKYDNSDWQVLQAGGFTTYGTISMPTVGLAIDTSSGGKPSLAIPADGEVRIHGVAGKASLRIDGSVFVDESSALQVTGPANLATTTGNVGIGTTSAKTKLDVRGPLRLEKGASNDDPNILIRANYPDSWGWKVSAYDYGSGIDLDIWGSNASDTWTKWATFSNQATSGRPAFTARGNVEVTGTLIMTGGRVEKTTLFDGGAGASTLYAKAENVGRLRMGAAWGIPGIYSEDSQDIVVGIASGRKVKLGTNGKFVEVDSAGNICLPTGAGFSTCGGGTPGISGDLSVQGSIYACLGNATGCTVKFSDDGGFYDRNDGWLTMQSGNGFRVRNAGNTDWIALQSGNLTVYGTVSLPSIGGMNIDTAWGGNPSFTLPGSGEIRFHGANGQASLRVDGSIYVDENSSIQVTGPANLAIATGNVGIGTSSAKAKLDVRGGIRTEKGASNDDPNILLRANYPDSYGWKFSAADRNNGIDLDVWGSNASDSWTKWATFSNQSTSGRPALTVNGNTEVTGNLVMTGGKVLKTTLFEADNGGAGATTLYSKAEGVGRLRMGAAWSIPGIYSEDSQDIVVGMATGKKAKIGTSPKFVEVDSSGNLCLPSGAGLSTCGGGAAPISGDLNVQGSIYACLANATGCTVKFSDDGGFYDRNDGWLTMQSGNGFRVRNSNNTDWIALQSGNLTVYGTVSLPSIGGMNIDTAWGGNPSFTLPGSGEIRFHGANGQASLRVDGSIYVDENSGLQVTGPANLAINTGKVGVGTTSPSSKLTIVDPDKYQLEIGKAGSSSGIQFHAGDSNATIQMLKYSTKHAGFVWDGSTMHIKGMSSGQDHNPDTTLNNTEGVNVSMYGDAEVRGNLVMTGGKVLKTTLFQADNNGAGGTTLYSKAESQGRLRIGAAWNIPGLYSCDDGAYDLVLGTCATKRVKLGVSPKFVEIDESGNLYLPDGASIKGLGGGQQQTCDGTVWNNNCYKFFGQTGVTWHQAEAACVSWGGHLISVHSTAERDFVYGLGCCGGGVWLGGNDEANEGQWVWTDGTPWDYTSWNGGEPNNSGNEDYLEGMWCGNSSWNDISTNNTDNCYTCKKSMSQGGFGVTANLNCTTVSGAGSAGGCWGASYIYCPAGYIMTGGGMSEPNYPFEQSRPCDNGEGQCWVCDNYPGCGSGTCWVRCCKVEASLSGFGTNNSNCKTLKQTGGSLPSGIYTIDPDQGGPIAPFKDYCDMSGDGGGWTLVMKINGGTNTFIYSSSYWENDTLLNEGDADLNEVQAKFRSYNTVPFTEVRVCLKDGGTLRCVNIPKNGSNLLDVMKGGYQGTSLGRDKWKSLVSSGSLQPSCNREGFNTLKYNDCYWDTGYGGVAQVRIGMINNQEGDCCSPDSRIGVGGGGSYCGMNQDYAAGNECTCSCDNGDRHTPTWGYVYVR